MKFFLDSTSINEIKEAFDLNILDGITTNPTLISKQSKTIDILLKDMRTIWLIIF